MIVDRKLDEKFIGLAIEQARKSFAEGGLPIGAGLVRESEVVAVGHNQRIQLDNPVLHAEIDCLQNAGRMRSYRNCVLYSTLMPCYLCAGAVVQFGIERVVAGESRNFAGAQEFMREHGVDVVDLDLGECTTMMAKFIADNPALWAEDIADPDGI